MLDRYRPVVPERMIVRLSAIEIGYLTMVSDDPLKPREESQSDAVLKRLLATPPDHKRNVKSDASPKKRGRPPKASGPVHNK
jgi:hypothetical protein